MRRNSGCSSTLPVNILNHSENTWVSIHPDNNNNNNNNNNNHNNNHNHNHNNNNKIFPVVTKFLHIERSIKKVLIA